MSVKYQKARMEWFYMKPATTSPFRVKLPRMDMSFFSTISPLVFARCQRNMLEFKWVRASCLLCHLYDSESTLKIPSPAKKTKHRRVISFFREVCEVGHVDAIRVAGEKGVPIVNHGPLIEHQGPPSVTFVLLFGGSIYLPTYLQAHICVVCMPFFGHFSLCTMS
ncbi:hypothetical protein NE237_019318 [Protea cynaroides]|uniref:Uncharacterized protein n=1 Tax=Protea cynaroides TaxID=273540 RepID=A0A9Q0QPZ6_9MAGN|nr:hypothetical protein NE237_019318 [Protea cynaroides]